MSKNISGEVITSVFLIPYVFPRSASFCNFLYNQGWDGFVAPKKYTSSRLPLREVSVPISGKLVISEYIFIYTSEQAVLNVIHTILLPVAIK